MNNTTSPDTTARAVRERRREVAHLLVDAALRADLEWADLAHLPDWADRPADELDALAWATAAWLHAHELRRCIDGPVLSLLRTRLGESAFAALRSTPPPGGAPESTPPSLDLAAMSAPQLDALLLSRGRDCLLASVESSALRRCLREHWWQAVSGPVIAPSTALAQAAVRAALDHMPHTGQTDSSCSPGP
ncbi:MAG TPA: hypothetical protein VFP68_05300 [Burkholderiaceae bacterium]|nr:hypothetical protein [Burkholderiaceae bacterium]